MMNPRKPIKKHKKTAADILNVPPNSKPYPIPKPTKKHSLFDQWVKDMIEAGSHEGVVLRHRMDRGKPVKIKTLGEEELNYIADHVMYYKALDRFLNAIVNKNPSVLNVIKQYIRKKGDGHTQCDNCDNMAQFEYVLPSENTPNDVPVTICLCDECNKIQESKIPSTFTKRIIQTL